MNHYDVIVVGAGHAGIEACLATSRLGLNTLIVTTRLAFLRAVLTTLRRIQPSKEPLLSNR